MLGPNSILKSVTSFLRLCLYNSKENLDKCFLSTLWGHHLGNHETLYLDLHHRPSPQGQMSGTHAGSAFQTKPDTHHTRDSV